MTTVDVDRLQFVDVRQEKVGNFMEPTNLDRFLASELGRAQEKLMREQMVQQGFQADEITTSMIRRALFTEQAAQDTNYRSADLSNKQLLDSHGSAWYQRLGDLVSNWGRAGKEGAESTVRAGAEATATHVRNEGMTGEASRALSGREAQIERAVNEALGIKP